MLSLSPRADAIANSNAKPLTTSQLNDIFDDETKSKTHNRRNTTESDSGIGGAGTLIFDSYDEDILFRDAYNSPEHNPENFPKRPSLELDLNDTDEKGKESNARGSVPNTPKNESSDEESDDLVLDDKAMDAMPNKNTEYIMQSQASIDSSVTMSSKKTADTGLLHKDHHHATTTNGIQLEAKHSGFVSIGGGMDTAMKMGSRPSRTPSPIRDADASILIEKTTGCSCFGWFGKKKKKKNIGLAQQELR